MIFWHISSNFISVKNLQVLYSHISLDRLTLNIFIYYILHVLEDNQPFWSVDSKN